MTCHFRGTEKAFFFALTKGGKKGFRKEKSPLSHTNPPGLARFFQGHRSSIGAPEKNVPNVQILPRGLDFFFPLLAFGELFFPSHLWLRFFSRAIYGSVKKTLRAPISDRCP